MHLPNRVGVVVAVVFFASSWSVGRQTLADDFSALNTALSTIKAADLQRHVDVLADDTFEGRKAGTRGGRAAAGYIAQKLQAAGVLPAGENGGFYQRFRGNNYNVLGMLPGADDVLKNDVLLIGAHYDHVGYGSPSNSNGPTGYIHNGADDNASGVAGLLELIEAFQSLPNRPARTVLFAFWDGEEDGLLGSKHWVRQPTLEWSRVRFAINLDMIGRLRKNRVLVYGTRTTRGLRRLVSEENAGAALDLEFSWEMKNNSDHHSFYAANIPVLMLHTDLHDDYHRPSDDAHLVNAEGMRRVSRVLFRVARRIANSPSTYPFRARSVNASLAEQQRLRRPLPPARPRLGVVWRMRAGERPQLELLSVGRNSAAHAGGLQAGDRIVALDGKPIVSDAQARSLILAARKGLHVSFQRGNANQQRVSVTLNGPPVRLGIAWREDDAEPGVILVRRISPGGPAQQAGILSGDRIYQINGDSFDSGDEFL